MTYFDPIRERDDALAQDAMSAGEYHSCALKQYAAAYGEEHLDSAWILSPFDTWERNPLYSGPPQPHPEDDYFEDDRAEMRHEVGKWSPIIDPDWDDAIPF